jgi:hypothetical protein
MKYVSCCWLLHRCSFHQVRICVYYSNPDSGYKAKETLEEALNNPLSVTKSIVEKRGDRHHLTEGIFDGDTACLLRDSIDSRGTWQQRKGLGRSSVVAERKTAQHELNSASVELR